MKAICVDIDGGEVHLPKALPKIEDNKNRLSYRINMNNITAFYDGRSYGTADLSISPLRMDGKLSNSLINADIALVSSQLEISISKMPILKEAVFLYDLSGQKGSFHSPNLDFEIFSSDNKITLVGPGIAVEAVGGNIDAELSISGFSLKGSFSKDTGEVRGTIVSEKTKNINIFWKEKSGTVISTRSWISRSVPSTIEKLIG